jgi:hypothetical protein
MFLEMNVDYPSCLEKCNDFFNNWGYRLPTFCQCYNYCVSIIMFTLIEEVDPMEKIFVVLRLMQ